MAKSRQSRKGGGGKRGKRPLRPAAAPVTRVQPDNEVAAPEAAARRAAPASRSTPVGGSRASSASRPAPLSVSTAAAGPVDFGQEYRYVLGDLKRIAILAAVMFAALVVLALILT